MTKIENYLVKLSEECAEVSRRCAKALRFGINEVQHGQELNNAVRLRLAMAGVMAACEELMVQGVAAIPSRAEIETAKRKAKEYLEYSEAVGTVIPPFQHKPLKRKPVKQKRH